MGRSTWGSLPKRVRPLKGRDNIVLSTTMGLTDGIKVYSSLDEAVETLDKYDQVAIMGGSRLYDESMSFVDELVITNIKKDFEGDVYFPKIDTDLEWKLKESIPHDSGLFSFDTYVRK
jgi:dihydrofolate reductase